LKWSKIINKEENTLYIEKVQRIASVLNNHSPEDFSLLSGAAGQILFHFYHSRVFNNNRSNDKAMELINHIFDHFNSTPLGYTFSSGLAGIGWLIEFIEQQGFIQCDTDDIIGQLDDLIYNTMIAEIKAGEFDYLHAAGGMVLYYLTRKNNKKINSYISDYVDHLNDVCIWENDACKWFSAIRLSDGTEENACNLSMSHGLASIIAVLNRIYKRNINVGKTEKLISGSVRYLLSVMQSTDEFSSYFPDIVYQKEHKGQTSRMAWCYGDMGIGISLLDIAHTMNNKEWETIAIKVLLNCTKRRDLEKNHVLDACLCHGSAGLAHLLNRLYHKTNLNEFKEAAIFWYSKTIEFANDKKSLSGFVNVNAEEYGGSKEDFGFLVGISGIGLALLSGISDIDPTWDQILLIS